ncbi:hypothetical protein LX36DRAFT_357394 [Colletotrichum falcatum]|nr:hypothetical protein LX36DRAFT_357394 [Colletotrichum falcatum]
MRKCRLSLSLSLYITHTHTHTHTIVCWIQRRKAEFGLTLEGASIDHRRCCCLRVSEDCFRCDMGLEDLDLVLWRD